jgi:hypothetical protein
MAQQKTGTQIICHLREVLPKHIITGSVPDWFQCKADSATKLSSEIPTTIGMNLR